VTVLVEVVVGCALMVVIGGGVSGGVNIGGDWRC